MACLDLSDAGTRAVVRKFNLAPSHRIGRGRFCAVYADGADEVLKLTADPIQLSSVQDYLTGPHFPQLRGSMGTVGKQYRGKFDLSLFRAERLRPTRTADAATRKLARAVIKHANAFMFSEEATRRSNVQASWQQCLALRVDAALEQLVECHELPLSIREAFVELWDMSAKFETLTLDIHPANLMVRGYDELVLNDVIVDSMLL